jgi:hypothetical protein
MPRRVHDSNRLKHNTKRARVSSAALKSAIQPAAGTHSQRKIGPKDKDKDLAAYGIPGITGMPPECTHLPLTCLL